VGFELSSCTTQLYPTTDHLTPVLAKVLIFTKAFRESRIILTWDLDFTEILALSKTGTVSAVVFRLMNTRSDHVIARLERVLSVSAQDLQEGAIISMEEGRHRVRLLPLGRER
jgi:predicted nuclease of predicted toxin-antitoxin system